MALVCTLSVFNGFTNVISLSFNAIDPDLQITPNKGKVFNPKDDKIKLLDKFDEIESISQTLEENALVKYGDRQIPILVRGVSDNYISQVNFNKLLLDGDFYLKKGDIDYTAIGAGLAMSLGVQLSYIAPIEIYAPKRNVKINLANPATAFSQMAVYPSGIFALNQAKYDEQLVIVSLNVARELFRYETDVSALNLKLKENSQVGSIKKKIEETIGNSYAVKDRFEQQENSYRMVNIEKWVTFLILAFILIIAVFNVVGSLSMLILEKKEDIQILQNMGAGHKLILRIFMFEGWLISLSGAIIGLLLGLGLCLLQEHFGILTLGETPGAFIIDAYPVSVEVSDIIYILITVSLISTLSVLYPINNLRRKLRNEI